MSTADVELRENEQLVSDADELAYRQITKHMIDDGKVATTAFGPSTADQGMPSFSRSTLVTAQDSRDWYTRNAKNPSLGVWAVSVGEVVASGRCVVDDSNVPVADGTPQAPATASLTTAG